MRCLPNAAPTRIGTATGRNHERRSDTNIDSSIRIPNYALLRRRLILHTSILEQIRPLPTRPRMRVFQMLTKVIRTEELLRLIALAKLMDMVQMFGSHVPLWDWVVGEFVAAVAAHVGGAGRGGGG